MQGKTALVLGVANQRSIAWGITRALSAEGARVALTYQNERLREGVEQLAKTIDAPAFECDVASDEAIASLMNQIQGRFGGLDILVHSIAYAPREALEGRYADTSRDAFRTALDISCYSLVALARAAEPLMKAREGGSILTMTYYGSEKVMPGYNLMGVAKAALEASVRYLAYELGTSGIRVNAISAGPLNTLAARGISGFTEFRHRHAERAPLRRSIEVDEVAKTAVFLLGPAGSGITGEVVYVDAGYHIMGV